MAGPTEVVVAADASANPEWVAADLLAQAEHDVLAVPILVAVGRDVAEAIAQAVWRQLQTLPRREIAQAALEKSGVAIVVDTDEQAVDMVNLFAPEHAGLSLARAEALAPLVKHAGAVFVGHHASEATGDYMAGPSHVLPTGAAPGFAPRLGSPTSLRRPRMSTTPRPPSTPRRTILRRSRPWKSWTATGGLPPFAKARPKAQKPGKPPAKARPISPNEHKGLGRSLQPNGTSPGAKFKTTRG